MSQLTAQEFLDSIGAEWGMDAESAQRLGARLAKISTSLGTPAGESVALGLIAVGAVDAAALRLQAAAAATMVEAAHEAAREAARQSAEATARISEKISASIAQTVAEKAAAEWRQLMIEERQTILDVVKAKGLRFGWPEMSLALAVGFAVGAAGVGAALGLMP